MTDQEKAEREKDRRLIIKTCVNVMLESPQRKVRAEACGLLRDMGAISEDEHARLLKGWAV